MLINVIERVEWFIGYDFVVLDEVDSIMVEVVCRVVLIIVLIWVVVWW